MKRWLRGMLAVGVVAGPIATAASCASQTGTGSETHFVCANDEECIRAGKGDLCVEHRCAVLEGGASFGPDTGLNPVSAGGAGGAGGQGNRGGTGGASVPDSGSGGTRGGSGGTRGGSGGGPDSSVPEGGGGPVRDSGSNATCGDTQHDNANCGKCGHACIGASECIDGECHCASCGGSGYIAVDATRVYFTLDYGKGGIFAEQPLAGGTPTTLGTWVYSGGMTVTPTSVFYTDDTGPDATMYELAKAGGPATPLRSHIPIPFSIVNDGTNAYWLDSVLTAPGYSLKKVPLSGGPEITLASSLHYPQAVAVDTTGVYVTNLRDDVVVDGSLGDGEILKVPIGGGTPVVLATAPATTGIAVDATSVYWTSTDKILKAPLGGGAVTVLASGQVYPAQVVVDATHVYWTTPGQAENDGTIMKAPLAGGAATVLASQQYYPWAIAVDSAYVYWMDPFTGTAKRVAK